MSDAVGRLKGRPAECSQQERQSTSSEPNHAEEGPQVELTGPTSPRVLKIAHSTSGNATVRGDVLGRRRADDAMHTIYDTDTSPNEHKFHVNEGYSAATADESGEPPKHPDPRFNCVVSVRVPCSLCTMHKILHIVQRGLGGHVLAERCSLNGV